MRLREQEQRGCYIGGNGNRRVAPTAGAQESLQMSAFVYKRRSPLSIPLRLLDYAIAADSYGSMLSVLGSGIRGAEHRINSGGEEVADDKVETIENLLGVAYVACQPQITAIVHAVLRLPGHGLSARALRALGPRFDSNHSKIEVVMRHASGWRPWRSIRNG
jgi:hypothetical protein